MDEKRSTLCFSLACAFAALLSLGSTATVQAQTDPAIAGCTTVAVAGEPKNPYKKPDGTYDQGSSGSCVFTSLVNSNIKAGADDTGGKFMKKLRLCLSRKGLGNLWRRGPSVDADGNPGPDHLAMLECKREARAANTAAGTMISTLGADVTFKVIKATEPWETRKMALANALATTPPGAALINSKGPNYRSHHSSSVLSIDCTAKTMKILDPNGTEHTLTFDDSGNITKVDPPNKIYEGGMVTFVTVEMQNP